MRRARLCFSTNHEEDPNLAHLRTSKTPSIDAVVGGYLLEQAQEIGFDLHSDP
jgi:hypothetical protein